MKPLLILFLLGACVLSPQQKLFNRMCGTWRMMGVEVRKIGDGLIPGDIIFAAKDSLELANTQGLSKGLGIYKADSTYTEEYYALDGKLVHEAAGRWYISNDSIVLKQERPPGPLIKLKLVDNDSLLSMSGLRDMDGDKAADDEFKLVVKKIK
ncbi:MAG: hypothetical protein SFW35_02160 [Chitinophagales bacterium]|nr:hypothetical protein [Chitinophagales bacterium]